MRMVGRHEAANEFIPVGAFVSIKLGACTAPSFDFAFKPQQFKDIFGGADSVIEAEYEHWHAGDICGIDKASQKWITFPKDESAYKNRGEWKQGETYAPMDMVSYQGALYILPSSKDDVGTPPQTWTLFRRCQPPLLSTSATKDEKSNRSGTTLTGKITRVSSLCLVREGDQWLMMCGHDGIVSCWSIPSVNLILQPRMYQVKN